MLLITQTSLMNSSVSCYSTVELGYNVMIGTEYFCVVIAEENNGMANREELIGITCYLTLWTRFRYNRTRLYMQWQQDLL